jgi:hypothetical protein
VAFELTGWMVWVGKMENHGGDTNCEYTHQSARTWRRNDDGITAEFESAVRLEQEAFRMEA